MRERLLPPGIIISFYIIFRYSQKLRASEIASEIRYSQANIYYYIVTTRRRC